MQPATNLTTLKSNLLTTRQITIPAFYIPLYDPILDQLRWDMKGQIGEEGLRFVVGQSGNGKTTALAFFVDEALSGHYYPVLVNGRELFSPDDIDIVDLLLLICTQLANTDERLSALYLERIENMARVFDGQLLMDSVRESVQEDELVTEGGLSLPKLIANLGFKLGVTGKMKVQASDRNIIREIFKPQLEDVVAFCNEVIEKIESLQGKKLLLVVDDLEKIKNQQQLRQLFLQHTHTLKHISCQKIFTLPAYFAIDREMEVESYRMWLATRSNPLDPGSKSWHDPAMVRQHFRRMVEVRVEAGNTLISEVAYEKAIDFSAGNPRQYVEILYRATDTALRYESDQVGADDVEQAIRMLAQGRNSTEILLPNLALLAHIQKHHLPPLEFKPEQLQDALARNQVFNYHDDIPWYGLDPIIAQTVKKYATLYG